MSKKVNINSNILKEWVINRRLELNISQAQLIRKLHGKISARTITNVENGKFVASYQEETLMYLAEGLDVKYKDMLISLRIIEGDLKISFKRFHQAAADWKERLFNAVKINNEVGIKWLGLTMDYGAPFLQETINEVARTIYHSKINIAVSMLDPTWELLSNLGAFYSHNIFSSYKKIEEINEIQLQQKSSINLELFFYRKIPDWHGFTINDEHIYYSRCTYKRGKWHGGENSYNYSHIKKDIIPDDIKEFLLWFESCKEIVAI